jgi:Holliday junction DNA helicase RuvA
MIYSLRGRLVHVQPDIAVIECGGIGFCCRITMTTARQLPQLGQEAMLYTCMNVRDDAVELFGFADKSELGCFQQLTSVNGVGPKAAISILSEMTAERFALAVASRDYKSLTRAQGIGPKLAQRIVLELKDKFESLTPASVEIDLGGPGVVSASGNAAKAVEALSVLGFTTAEASAAVAKLDSELPVETMVREALKTLVKPMSNPYK